MALALTSKHFFVEGDRRVSIVDATFDNSYPTGGYPLNYNTASVGLGARIDQVAIDGGNGYGLQYDYTNNKVKFFTSAGVETSNATDVSAVTARIRIEGK